MNKDIFTKNEQYKKKEIHKRKEGIKNWELKVFFRNSEYSGLGFASIKSRAQAIWE